MTWKAFIYPSPKLQELYRLALCICGVTILLGAWRDIGYHSGLLAVLPALFIYQFGSYLTTHSTVSTLSRQRLSLAMEFSDGVITGLLIALAAFDPIITLALGAAFLVTIVGAMKATAPLDLFGLFIGALMGFWLLPVAVAVSPQMQLLVTCISFSYYDDYC